MNFPVQIAFHNQPTSDAIEARIRELAEGLESFYDRIQSCRVVVDVPHRHRKEGNLFRVRIDLKVPHAELVVKREPADHPGYQDLDSALLEAFDDARRQLEDHVRRLRGHVKTHEPPPHARVSRVFADHGYGFLQTPEGREIYFHRNSVLNGGWARMHVGTEVVYVEELGEKGPQASTVKLVGRHNHA
jgi:cold shock CspA family protein